MNACVFLLILIAVMFWLFMKRNKFILLDCFFGLVGTSVTVLYLRLGFDFWVV